MSASFVKCANIQLSQQFEVLTGIKPSRNVGLVYDPMAPTDFEAGKLYTKDVISGITLSINIRAYVFRVFVMWDSVSGKIYDISDQNIDCGDLRFWFFRLEPLAYRRYLNKQDTLPFQIPDCTYKLTVTEIGVNVVMVMLVKPERAAEVKDITDLIEEFLTGFNIPSRQKENDLRLHNWRYEWNPADHSLKYMIDTGMTGYRFFENFLNFLSEVNAFDSVTID